MEPVRIAIMGSDATALRAECRRLGLTVGQRTHVDTLRKKLSAYNQTYLLYLYWFNLAIELFGDGHNINIATPEALVAGVSDRLYKRLQAAGYVLGEPNTSDAFTASAAHLPSSLRDEGNKQTFYIVGRMNKRYVNTRIFRDNGTSGAGSCDILFAAQCAFADVAETVATLEAGKEGA